MSDSPLVEEAISLPLFSEEMVEAFAPEDTEPLVLSSEDLLPDDAGEIVLNVEPGLQVALGEGAEITQTGTVESYITASGIDVSGLSYAVLSSGITLFHDGALQVLEDSATASAL